MKGLKSVWLLTHFCLFIYPWSLAFGQRAEAPVYSDGDSWQVRHEVTRGGFDVSGTCQQLYPEYLVRIVGGRGNVFGVNNDAEIAISFWRLAIAC